MRLSAAVRAGLGRWPWLVAPVFVTAGLALALGLAVEGHATYRVTRVLEVTEGAPAEAIFVFRSRDVLATAMQRAELRPPVPPEEVALHVTVKEAGHGRIHLTVERASKREALDLAAAIAGEASRRVEVIRASASKKGQEKIERIESNLRHRRLDRKGALAELDDLRRQHPQEIDERGQPLGTAQRRLISVRAKALGARREVALTDAEIEALARSVETTPEFVERSGASEETAGARASPSRGGALLVRLDDEIARARKELTDEHPHLAALLAERARLEAQAALLVDQTHLQAGAAVTPGPQRAARTGAAPVPNPLRIDLERRLSEAEVRRSRAAAQVAVLEEEEKGLAALFEKSVTLESKVRTINEDLRKAEADIEDMKRELAQVKDEAASDTTAHAALIDLCDDPTGDPGGLTKSGRGRSPQVVALRAEAPPGRLAILGAALGLMLGVLLAALAEAMDPVVRTAADVGRVLDMPVLATMPVASLAPKRPSSRARALSLVIWLAAFLLAAAVLVVLVYPGWERLSRVFSRAGEAPHEIEEVLP